MFTVLNPATAQPIAEVPLASLEQADAAIEAAHEAFQTWRTVAPGERARLLRRFAAGDVAAEAFGAEVVEHYLNRADVEIEAFEAAVTDWERYRGFERL
ncbi:MAG TPA: aldehyde dehydrogenase family protein [Solirubrobacterales bacterium]|nr:aldehyde dehydrogenase family protein [Solirubrobacterales bacterium]